MSASSLRIQALLVLLITLLVACGDATVREAGQGATIPPASSATVALQPTRAPTATPVPTAIPRLAAGVHVAGIDVGGLTVEEARERLDKALAPLLRPLEVRAGAARATLRPDEIDLAIPIDDMLAEARSARAQSRIPLEVRYDRARIQSTLESLAQQVEQPAAISVISDTETISRSFALVGGQRLDLDGAMKQIDERLRSLGGVRRVTLALKTGEAARPAPEQLQEQIEEMARQWKGVVGIYVYDLASGQTLATLNEQSVFSGASVMKVPILLQSYITLDRFNARQEKWLEKMIVESDNLSANQMLAASAGGGGTDEALKGALEMSEMLKGLGLEHTYQYMPYEASDYLINIRKIKIRRGPPREGLAPYTDADPVLRTTPAEISRIFLWIEQCSKGEGELFERFKPALTAERCQEMIARLEKNGDRTRIVAGLPPGARVAHKSGWIEDMQADVGIVRSPGGDFLLAVYLYREIIPGKTYLADEIAAPVIASFARLVYTYYNPIEAPDPGGAGRS